MKAKIISILSDKYYHDSFSRKLKVYKKCLSRSDHKFIALPEIRLCGKWLDDIGFKFGEEILVQYEKDKIIIKVKKEQVKN